MIFVFLHESRWFEKDFKNIEIEENKSGLNKFSKSESLNLLTTKNVEIKAFDKIKDNMVNGDYHLKGTDEDVKRFIVALNKTLGAR